MTDSQMRIHGLDEAAEMRRQRVAVFRTRAMALIREGLPDVVIARRLCCGPDRVARLRRAAGIQRQNGEWHNV